MTGRRRHEKNLPAGVILLAEIKRKPTFLQINPMYLKIVRYYDIKYLGIV